MSDYNISVRLTADGKDLVGAVQPSTDAIAKMGQATKQAASEAERLNAQQKGLSDSLNTSTQAQVNANYAAQKTAEQYRAQAESLGVASMQVQKLLDRYDPLGTKLRSLQSDFALLNKAATSGEIGKSSDLAVDKTYKALNEEIAKTQGLMAAAGAAGAEGFDKIEKGGLASAFSTVQARRELMVLGREAMAGDFSRMPGSFMVLANRIGLSGTALTTVLLPIAAVAAAAGIMIKAFSDGHKEIVEMNNALAVTNNYAGMTRGTMLELAQSMTTAGTLTLGTAKGIVTQLVASGQIGAQAIGSVAKLADDYAAATGRDIDKIGPELVKLFSDPARGAAELNKQMNFLSPAELEHIEHLTRIGELDRAQFELSERLAAQLPKHKDNLGALETAWNAVKGAAGGAWNAMLGMGRDATLQEEIARITQQIVREKNNPLAVAQLKEELFWAKQRLLFEQGITEEITKQTDALKTQNEAAALVKQTSEYQKITELRDKLTLANKLNVSTDEERQNKARAIFDLNRQILDAYRGIGAESRQLSEERLAGALKLYEIENKGAADQIETQFKLGNITKQARDAQLVANALDLNAEKQMSVSQQLRYALLLPAERERLQITLQTLAAQANAIRDRGDDADLIAREQLRAAQAEADAKAAQASTAEHMKAMESLNKEIAAQKLHNAEIGKTKEQIDRLKAAELDRAILRLETSRGIDAEDAAQSEAGRRYLDQVDDQLAKLRQLRGEQLRGATLDAQDASNKKQLSDWNNLWSTVERTGKETFTILALGGENMATRVGKAIKASIVDLLYQLTLRPWMIQIGTSIAGSLGISTAANAATSGIGAGAVGSIGQATMGTLSTSEVIGTLFASGEYAAALAAIPGVGWAALAAAAAVAIFSAGGGGPKPSTMAINTSGIGGPAGALAITASDMGTNMTVAQYQAIDDWLEQLPDKLKAAVDGMKLELTPGADAAQAWAQLQAQVNAVAGTLGLTADELKRLQPAAAQAAAAIATANQKQTMEIELMKLQGNTSDAVAREQTIYRASLDESLRPLQDLIWAQQEANAADAARLEIAKTRQGWQDQLDVLLGVKMQREIDLKNALATTTDLATQTLIKQVFAQQDIAAAATATATAAAAAAQSISTSASQIQAATPAPSASDPLVMAAASNAAAAQFAYQSAVQKNAAGVWEGTQEQLLALADAMTAANQAYYDAVAGFNANTTDVAKQTKDLTQQLLELRAPIMGSIKAREEERKAIVAINLVMYDEIQLRTAQKSQRELLLSLMTTEQQRGVSMTLRHRVALI